MFANSRFRYLCLALTVSPALLKAAGVIDWPWGWVLAPIWIPMAIAVTAAVTVLFMALHMSGKDE